MIGDLDAFDISIEEGAEPLVEEFERALQRVLQEHLGTDPRALKIWLDICDLAEYGDLVKSAEKGRWVEEGSRPDGGLAFSSLMEWLRITMRALRIAKESGT